MSRSSPWIKQLAGLGYGSRRQIADLFAEGRVTTANGEPLRADDDVVHADVRIDGMPLDPASGVLLMLHKPVGYVCSTRDQGRLIYELLPPRFCLRSPIVSAVGRLDRDTSGLLLMTDDGGLLHRIISPKSKLPKTYEVELAQDLRGDEAAIFASGELMLRSERTALLPVWLQVSAPRRATVTLTEGRYHQVRRMFAAVGNHVECLHRCRVGGLELKCLEPGAWRELTTDEKEALFSISSGY
ncbi:MAG: pseudouridine synthase [Xanthomonadaceae bacterium]|jgi:16S rRNA pseudouridine516 synthase|nr:pseudouridine synthase [Xanthomonadaceae bacterium]